MLNIKSIYDCPKCKHPLTKLNKYIFYCETKKCIRFEVSLHHNKISTIYCEYDNIIIQYLNRENSRLIINLIGYNNFEILHKVAFEPAPLLDWNNLVEIQDKINSYITFS